MSYRITVTERKDDKDTEVYSQTVEALNVVTLAMVVNGLARVPRIGFVAQQPLDAAGPVPPRVGGTDPPIDPVDPTDPVVPVEPIDYSDPSQP